MKLLNHYHDHKFLLIYLIPKIIIRKYSDCSYESNFFLSGEILSPCKISVT
jgi:hypothetical protein